MEIDNLFISALLYKENNFFLISLPFLFSFMLSDSVLLTAMLSVSSDNSIISISTRTQVFTKVTLFFLDTTVYICGDLYACVNTVTTPARLSGELVAVSRSGTEAGDDTATVRPPPVT